MKFSQNLDGSLRYIRTFALGGPEVYQSGQSQLCFGNKLVSNLRDLTQPKFLSYVIDICPSPTCYSSRLVAAVKH